MLILYCAPLLFSTTPFITSRYTGFVSVSAVTSYELAIKAIFCGFADQRHEVLGKFVSKYFNRINGQIMFDKLKDDYVPRFGMGYTEKFKEKVEESETLILNSSKKSMKQSYRNIIVWRNGFIHEGSIPQTTTLEEVINSYHLGKGIIDCLSVAMHH